MSAPTVATKWVYDFHEGSREMRNLLGGKGSGVAEMTRILGPGLVPEGFTVTTDACVEYMRLDRTPPHGLAEAVDEALVRLETRTGRRLGDSDDPLLVSVRSGARDSMPGMMDTVLNLGLNDDSVRGLAARTGDERFAWDSYRRLVQMFGNVVCGVPGERFEDAIAEIKRDRGATLDTELDVAALRELTRHFQTLYDFPADPREQLERAIRAVFDSWSGERAVAYRRINGIPDDWGTAVNVQQMVFGNRGERSCSGVAFSRDEITGAPDPSGDFLRNAQGEDVVSGVRTPDDLSELRDWMPEIHAELVDILRTLERHAGDMQDTEFTVEEGRLYMLQTRNAKRPAQAAVRFAVDAVDEGFLTSADAIQTIDAGRLDALLHPTFDPDVRYEVLARGVAASPGAAKGQIVFTAEDAVAAAADGRSVILVRPFTEAADVAGFHAARGILTSEGGKASHAALVARGMGRPAVTGVAALDVDLARLRGPHRRARAARGRPHRHRRDDRRRHDRRRPARGTARRPRASQPCSDGATACARSACAPTPTRPPTRAAHGRSARRGSGCAGPSTCSWPPTASPRCRRRSWPRAPPSDAPRSMSCCRCSRPTSRACSRRWTSLPVTIRLLDPPLHEFLPDRQELVERLTEARLRGTADVAELEHVLERMRALEEGNPMLGTRGVRLGLMHPDLYEMQARAIFRARVRGARAHRQDAERRGDDPAGRLRAELELARARSSGSRPKRDGTAV